MRHQVILLGRRLNIRCKNSHTISTKITFKILEQFLKSIIFVLEFRLLIEELLLFYIFKTKKYKREMYRMTFTLTTLGRC